MIADAVIGRKSGSLASFAPISDTRAPLNVNDSELDPEMKETPVESTRPTEMLFCLSRYEFGQWLDRHSKSNQATFGGYWALISSPSIPAEEKERTIKEIEDSFEEKFVRFCDPSIPLHLMTMLVARSTGSIMRLTAHHPRLYHERGENPTQSEKDFLFETCISVAEYSNILMTSNKTRRYLWHVDYHFPWDILLFMLHELRHRTVGDQTAKAWHLIDATCNRQYQTLGSKARSPFHLAIASLAIKAWASHVAECERRRTSSIPQPNIISVFWPLSQQAQPSSTPQMAPSLSESGQGGPPTASNAAFSAYSRHSGDPFMPAIPIDSSTDFSSLAQMHPADDSPLDWGQWDGLLQDYQQQFSGENPFGAI